MPTYVGTISSIYFDRKSKNKFIKWKSCGKNISSTLLKQILLDALF